MDSSTLDIGLSWISLGDSLRLGERNSANFMKPFLEKTAFRLLLGKCQGPFVGSGGIPLSAEPAAEIGTGGMGQVVRHEGRSHCCLELLKFKSSQIVEEEVDCDRGRRKRQARQRQIYSESDRGNIGD